MTAPVIAAPMHARYAPCGLAPATPPVPFNVPFFDSFQSKAGRS